MNKNLKKEIINNIFKTFGMFRKPNDNINTFFNSIISDEFVVNKKLVIETDDGKNFESKIYTAFTKVQNLTLNIIVADISNEFKEFALIIQMDNNDPCALRLSDASDDFGSMYFNLENHWIEASTLAQAKILVGIESLTEILAQWEKLDKYENIYKKLIDFLNFYEENGE